MRITSKGQVTIPVNIRVQFGLLPDTEVTFLADGDSVRIVSTQPGPLGRGASLARRLRGRATTGMSTDEILALTRE